MADIRNTQARSNKGKVRMVKIYTNTDPDGKTEIITDLEIKIPGNERYHWEAKVDPGAMMNINALPLCCFRQAGCHMISL